MSEDITVLNLINLAGGLVFICYGLCAAFSWTFYRWKFWIAIVFGLAASAFVGIAFYGMAGSATIGIASGICGLPLAAYVLIMGRLPHWMSGVNRKLW